MGCVIVFGLAVLVLDASAERTLLKMSPQEKAQRLANKKHRNVFVTKSGALFVAGEISHEVAMEIVATIQPRRKTEKEIFYGQVLWI